jgi:hypothetical protein
MEQEKVNEKAKKSPKIGFFQKWNEEAGRNEFSVTRLQMILFTLFDVFFVYQYYITEGNEITVNSLVLVVILLTAAYTPKAVQDFTDMRKKIK